MSNKANWLLGHFVDSQIKRANLEGILAEQQQQMRRQTTLIENLQESCEGLQARIAMQENDSDRVKVLEARVRELSEHKQFRVHQKTDRVFAEENLSILSVHSVNGETIITVAA